MDPQTRELWTRLQTFDFDAGPAAFTFRDRLARDNGWPRPFANRVIDEYRRFLLLAAHAGHPVTPSDEVDQAWHLHLTYTRSYWEDLCGRVLPAPLHHGPTRGGADEAAKFDDWYARTLASYRRLFDREPPSDIWPPAAVRFGRAPHFRRLDTSSVWLVPKPSWAPVRRHPLGAGLLLALGVTAGCAAAEVPTMLLAGAAALIVVVVALRHRGGGERRGREQGSRDGGDGGSVPFWASGGDGGTDKSDDGHGGHDGGGGDGGADGGGSSGCSSSGCGGGGCGGGGCGS